jgi:K+/H+ antiporter YhaU regulatory subunit KhtT
MINVNLLPDEPLMRWGVALVLIAVTIFGWKRFAQAGRRAGRRFNEALVAEKRRSSANVATTLSVPGDFYNRIPVTASAVVGRTIRELDIRVKTGALIVSVTRQGEKVRNPGPTWAFAADDEVMAIGEPAQLAALRALLSK